MVVKYVQNPVKMSPCGRPWGPRVNPSHPKAWHHQRCHRIMSPFLITRIRRIAERWLSINNRIGIYGNYFQLMTK